MVISQGKDITHMVISYAAQAHILSTESQVLVRVFIRHAQSNNGRRRRRIGDLFCVSEDPLASSYPITGGTRSETFSERMKVRGDSDSERVAA
jgi:hypothetical protein